jgi:hypothetical protein
MVKNDKYFLISLEEIDNLYAILNNEDKEAALKYLDEIIFSKIINISSSSSYGLIFSD